jgi:hypothetical protein
MAQNSKLSNYGRVGITSKTRAEGDHIEREVHYATSITYSIHPQEEFQGTSNLTFAILARYLVIFPAALVPQLQLWHPNWLVLV